MNLKRLLSRKFIVSLAAQLAAIGTLIWPAHEDAIVSGVQAIASLAVLVLASLGYVRMEGALDRQALARAMGSEDPPS
jgi:hypothetical protein